MTVTQDIRLKYLYSPSGEANHPSEEVLSVYRDHGVVPKSSRTDNFNKTPENVERYLLVQAGDLVVNRMKAWQGSLGVSPCRGIVSGDYEVLRPVSDSFSSRYMHYALRSRHMLGEYRVRSTGIRPSQWRLYWDQLGDIRISLPPLDEQQRIAEYLDHESGRINILIAEQQRLVEMLRERRAAVLQHAVRQGVRDNRKLMDSGDALVGSLPAGWSIITVRRLATSLDSHRVPLSAEEREGRQGPYPYYGATAIIDSVDEYLFDEPLVLVAEDGFGLLYRSKPIAVAVEGKIWVNNHAHVLRPRGVPHTLLAARIEAESLVPYFSGSRQPKLTADALMGMRISFPPPEEWDEIISYLEEQTAQIDSLIVESERLIELSQERLSALITAAVTGQIDVRQEGR